MKSHRYLFVAVLILGALACNSTVPVPAPGQASVPSETPFIAPSYPTAEAAVASPNQQVSGLDVRVERAWQEGKQVYVDVCFTLPDGSDWTIWAAHLQYGETVVQEYGATLKSQQDGQPAVRCDTLEFYVPPDADLSSTLVSIDAFAAFPREGDYCTIYMPKIQQVLDERGSGITLACNDVNGVLTMQIVNKPEGMSQETAEQIVYSDEFFTIKGPWQFTLNLQP